MKHDLLLREFLTFVLLMFLVSSCDRVGNYQAQVINTLDKPISVTFIDTNLFTDSLKTFVINAGDSAIILTSHTGVLGRSEKPKEVFFRDDHFTMADQFQVEVDHIVLKKDLRLSKEWTYTAVDTKLGVYRLQIDSTDYIE